MHLNLLEVADLTDILQKRLNIQGPSFGAMPMMGAPAQGRTLSPFHALQCLSSSMEVLRRETMNTSAWLGIQKYSDVSKRGSEF